MFAALFSFHLILVHFREREDLETRCLPRCIMDQSFNSPYLPTESLSDISISCTCPVFSLIFTFYSIHADLPMSSHLEHKSVQSVHGMRDP